MSIEVVGKYFCNCHHCLSFTATCATGSSGITSCAGLGAGFYQSCLGCTVYATCDAGGNLFDNRPCPPGLVWDNDVKQCRSSSGTCSVSGNSMLILRLSIGHI